MLRTVSRKFRRLFRSAPQKPQPHSIVAVGEQGSAVFARLLELCRSAEVPFFTGGAEHASRRRINLHIEDADRFRALVADSLGQFIVGFQRRGKFRPLTALPKEWSTRARPAAYDLLVRERSSPNVTYVSRIDVDFWGFRSHYDERIVSGARGNAHFWRVRSETLAQIFERRADIDSADGSHLDSVSFPIDAVYTWVDDQDPEWRARKARFAAAAGRMEGRATHAERFRNRDELRYSLRSLELFAPFIRRIFIVTDDQTPSWLNLDHPKVQVVSHRQIFKDPNVLPCFNSSAIESQLHHIDGLAEHFLYFNDDFFLGRLCEPNDFFWANGLPRFFPSRSRVNEYDVSLHEEYLLADRNAIELFRRDFGFYTHLIMKHVPYPSRRSILYDLEEKYGPELAQCASQRFRSGKDLRPIAFMQPHYSFHRGLAAPGEISHRYLALWKENIEVQLANTLKSRKYQTFCINDVGLRPEREAQVNAAVVDFLQAYFPLESTFETDTSGGQRAA